ncbi:MAG: TetR/AcrR family transcriptional regulator [Bacteroidales bacterium]|nr:TetR/AcrR family transcriptional regulator [Bacteroidales bacterium]
MNNKEIQEERVRGYFLDATKNILKGEGLKGISVRSVAQEAGYSFATLYNYFKDINDLVFLCVKDFQQEISEFVDTQSGKARKPETKIAEKTLAYIKYFAEYPGIFELFYLTKAVDFNHKKESMEIITNSLDMICEKEWKAFDKGKGVTPKEIDHMRNLLRHTVIGMMLLYLNRRQPEDYLEFVKEAEKEINTILKLH